MEKMKKKKLVLENGDVYIGKGFGADTDAIGEIVFNTAMAATTALRTRTTRARGLCSARS